MYVRSTVGLRAHDRVVAALPPLADRAEPPHRREQPPVRDGTARDTQRQLRAHRPDGGDHGGDGKYGSGKINTMELLIHVRS